MKMRLSICCALAIGAGLPAPSAVYSKEAPAAESRAVRAPPTAQGRLEDLKAFRDRFLAVNKSYAPPARAEAERRLAVLQGQVATVSQPYFELELARIVALADDGHTHYVLSSISRYYNRAPIRLATFGQDFYVVRAVEADADLLGARLVSIDGHPVDALRQAGRELTGGPAARRDRFSFDLLESPELLRALNLATRPEEAVYRFETPAGKAMARRLAGTPPGTSRPFSGPSQVLFPERLPLEDRQWKTALSRDKAPWSLRAQPILFRSRPAPEIEAMVIELRQNSDGNGFRIADVLRQWETEIRRSRPTNIVVDMRINDGGDLRTTRAFMEKLPRLIPGRIFVLTGPLTFSAGIASVGYLEQAAPSRVTIVGEPVGDRLMFFAEGHGADLPNSKGMIGLGLERHDYAGGCRAYKDCEVAVVRHPIAVASLAPDISAPWTIQAYLAGRDPAMEAVAAALRAPSR
jgi:hypothetical protein